MDKKKIIFLALTAVLLLLFSLSLNTTAQNLKVHFIDVGQGDSILIEEPGGHNILIDGGDRADIIAAQIINYLKDRQIKKLDYIISTHPHADHIGGLVDIIDSFEIGSVLDSGKIHSSKTYENYLIKIDQENISFDTPRQGDKFKIGAIEIHFLHPDQSLNQYNLNNSSLVFVLNYGQQRFLFTGDIEKEVEKELLAENPNLKADIIKVPHHGSDTSSSTAWVKSLEPKTAVIQVGGDNSYGHPKSKIIKLYQTEAANVFRNDLNGNIVITADGRNHTVKIDRSSNNIMAGAELDSKNNNTSKTETSLININSAEAAVLDKLWGIGPATAEKIIKYRNEHGPFEKLEEIKKVNSIDDYKFERWQDKITIN